MARKKSGLVLEKNRITGILVLAFLILVFILLLNALNFKQILFPSARTFRLYATPRPLGTPINIPKYPVQTLKPPIY